VESLFPAHLLSVETNPVSASDREGEEGLAGVARGREREAQEKHRPSVFPFPLWRGVEVDVDDVVEGKRGECFDKKSPFGETYSLLREKEGEATAWLDTQNTRKLNKYRRKWEPVLPIRAESLRRIHLFRSWIAPFHACEGFHFPQRLSPVFL